MADRSSDANDISAAVETLLADYEACRSEAMSELNLVAAIIGAAVTLLGGLIAFMSDGEPVVGSSDDLVGFLSALLVPIAPAALLGYGVVLATRQTLRSYYLRELEHSIHRATGNSTSPMWAHIDIQTAGHRGPPSTKAIWALIYTVLACAALGVIVLAVRSIDGFARGCVVALVNSVVTVPVAIVGWQNVTAGYAVWRRYSAMSLRDSIIRGLKVCRRTRPLTPQPR